MTYSLKLFTPGDNGRVVRSGISEETYIKMVKARDSLQRIMTVVDYFNMFLGNAEELAIATKQVWPSQIKGWAEINRKFLNYVSAYYAFIEFMEYTYKDIISVVKSKFYDTHFEYRLIYNLRIYSTHREPAISTTTYDMLKGTSSIQISPARLLEYGEDCFQPLVRKELLTMAESSQKIDVAVLAEEFKKIFVQLNNDVMRELDVIAAKANELLYSFYADVKSPSDYIVCDDSGEEMWSISGVLVKYREKMEHERHR